MEEKLKLSRAIENFKPFCDPKSVFALKSWTFFFFCCKNLSQVKLTDSLKRFSSLQRATYRPGLVVCLFTQGNKRRRMKNAREETKSG